jgi:hypothetical protein
LKTPRPPTPGWRPSTGRLVIALLLGVAGALLLWALLAPSGPVPDGVVAAPPPPPPAHGAPVPAPAVAARQAPPPMPEGDADPTRDLSSYVARGENPSMAEVIERLHERGIHSGLGAFSPPGTSPPLVGLAVPDDFALPKGYVRHHQATDDGQRIEAILMFAPDFQLLDAAGQPLPMPANRVVPPELAPPGLPIRRIVIPPPNDPLRR